MENDNLKPATDAVQNVNADASPAPKKKYIGKREFIMFGIAAGGQGMIYATMSSYISDFYINVMGLPLVFVLLLMLLARVWDAVNDPMMGVIVDKCTTPWGKMKPYVLFTALPIAALTFLMFFSPPGLNSTELMVYAAFVYVGWGMVYTVSDVPFWSMPNVMTPDPAERANTISFGRTVNGIGSAVPMVLFAVLSWIPFFSGESSLEAEKIKYIVMAVTASVVGIALFVTSYFTTKERVQIPAKPRRDKSEPNMLKRIFNCKPLMLVVIMGVLSSGRYMMQAAAVHVARYAFYIGPSLEGLTGTALQEALIQICSAIGMFGSMLIMPLLYKKFNYKQIVIATCVAGFVASVCTTVIGACSIYTAANWLVYLLIPFIIIQCVACQSFVNKLGNALATTFIVIMYIIVNIDPAQSVAQDAIKAVTEMSNGQRFGMFSLVSIVPGVSLILCAIPIFFYDLTGKKKEKITAELAAKRAELGIEIEA